MLAASPQSTYARGSSSPFISGVPSSFAVLSDYIDSFDDTLAEAIVAACDQARNEIRSLATRDPEWEPYADLLDVEFKDGGFEYVLVGDQADIDKALALEYGAVEGHSPSSILRKTAIAQAHELGKTVSESLKGAMPFG